MPEDLRRRAKRAWLGRVRLREGDQVVMDSPRGGMLVGRDFVAFIGGTLTRQHLVIRADGRPSWSGSSSSIGVEFHVSRGHRPSSAQRISRVEFHTNYAVGNTFAEALADYWSAWRENTERANQDLRHAWRALASRAGPLSTLEVRALAIAACRVLEISNDPCALCSREAPCYRVDGVSSGFGGSINTYRLVECAPCLRQHFETRAVPEVGLSLQELLDENEIGLSDAEARDLLAGRASWELDAGGSYSQRFKR